jgi:hypothetical protein
MCEVVFLRKDHLTVKVGGGLQLTFEDINSGVMRGEKSMNRRASF